MELFDNLPSIEECQSLYKTFQQDSAASEIYGAFIPVEYGHGQKATPELVDASQFEAAVNIEISEEDDNRLAVYENMLFTFAQGGYLSHGSNNLRASQRSKERMTTLASMTMMMCHLWQPTE
eukprot:scaffold345_cov44-Attheya_sp.AAC.6